MPDPNQQQQPGLLDSIEGGLGKVLPYALPVGLGLAMGAPVGMGLAGAAAGLSSAEGQAGERQQQQQEMAMKEKELGIRAQEADIEIQKGKMALASEDDKTAYAKTIKDPTLRQMYKDDAPAYFKNVSWNGTVDSIGMHPEFQKQNPRLTPDVLRQLGPEIGPKVLQAAMTKQPVIGKQAMQDKSGNWIFPVFNPDGTVGSTPAPGAPQSLVIKETPAAGKGGGAAKPPTPSVLQGMALKAKAAASAGSGNFAGMNFWGLSKDDQKKVVSSDLIAQLTATGMDDDAAQKLAGPAVDAAFPELKDPNELLKKANKATAGLPPPPPGFHY